MLAIQLTQENADRITRIMRRYDVYVGIAVDGRTFIGRGVSFTAKWGDYIVEGYMRAFFACAPNEWERIKGNRNNIEKAHQAKGGHQIKCKP